MFFTERFDSQHAGHFWFESSLIHYYQPTLTAAPLDSTSTLKPSTPCRQDQEGKSATPALSVSPNRNPRQGTRFSQSTASTASAPFPLRTSLSASARGRSGACARRRTASKSAAPKTWASSASSTCSSPADAGSPPHRSEKSRCSPRTMLSKPGGPAAAATGGRAAEAEGGPAGAGDRASHATGASDAAAAAGSAGARASRVVARGGRGWRGGGTTGAVGWSALAHVRWGAEELGDHLQRTKRGAAGVG